MNMQKILLVVCTFFCFAAYSQSVSQKQQSFQHLISPASFGPYEKGQVLNESAFLPVKKSDSVFITPQIEKGGRKNFFLKGLLKTVGAGLLANKANRMVTADNKRGGKVSGGIGLSLGIGLAAGAPDYIKAFSRKGDPQVLVSFYNKEKKLISRQALKWKAGQEKPVKEMASQDGFLQVSFINGGKKIEKVGELKVDVITTTSLNFTNKSAVSPTASSARGGGETPPHDPDITITGPDGVEYHFYDNDGNGGMDAMTYWDNATGGPVVTNLVDYPSISWNDFGNVIQYYDSYQWPGGIEDYLTWYNEVHSAPPVENYGDSLINNLDSLPCFKKVLDSIARLPASDSIGKLMHELNNLGTNHDVSLKFVFNSAMASNVDGHTNSGGVSNEATNTININTILTNSSQEYKAITMIHEMLHAYISTITTYHIFNPSFSSPNWIRIQDLRNQGYVGEALSHELMARYFIDDMVSSLQQLFPGMDTERATALAWGGLGQTSLWVAKSDTEKNDIVAINNQEKYNQSGSTGTFCN